MALITDTVKQTGQRTEFRKGSNWTTVTYIGPVDAIVLSANAFREGAEWTPLSGAIVKSSTAEKIEADRMRWTVTYEQLSGGSVPDPGGGDYLDQTWQMNMTQWSFPLYRYLDSADVGRVRLWEESPFSIRQNFQYVSGANVDGEKTIENLYGRGLEVAKLLWNGTTEVARYFPQAVRTTQYLSGPITMTSAAMMLNHIDGTPGTVFKGYLSASWLKTGFDWTQNNDGTWTLTESWIGAEDWNKNLYGSGSDRWDFEVV